MRTEILLAIVSFISCCFCSPAKNEKFDHFVFTQEWPGSICWSLDGNCELPEKTNFWTIHGLWPSFQDTHSPNTCTDDKFDEKLILKIKNQLLVKWPNLLPNKGETSFWKHEWEKHGTCSLTMDELNSEYKYFAKTLELYDTYNILKGLKASGFKPSDDKLYELDDLDEALTNFLGVKGKLMCYSPKGQQVQHLAQIEFCLDKSFNPIECPHHRYSALQWNSNPNLTNLSKRKSQQQVYRMTANRRKQYTRMSEMNGKLTLNDCHSHKKIAYPTISH